MDHILPSSPRIAASVGLPDGESSELVPSSTKTKCLTNGFTATTLAAQILGTQNGEAMQLELKDGTTYPGFGFGASKSIVGELVFQTGMVGYPESLTDPSYRGQILVVTFPLVGNYGVPSRETMDEILGDLPAHFEATQIHVSGLVVASYSGEDYSHHLATSSLGTWLKEQGVPAMHGVDTRSLTKRIREEGSMLGKLLVELKDENNDSIRAYTPHDRNARYIPSESIDWDDPNSRNLVADGKSTPSFSPFRS